MWIDLNDAKKKAQEINVGCFMNVIDTSSYLFQCFTIKHFLITCTEFSYIPNRYFTAKTVKELFTDTSSDKIINFLKETNLFNKL